MPCPVVLKISANDTRKSTQNDVHLCLYITMIQSQIVVRPITLFVLIWDIHGNNIIGDVLTNCVVETVDSNIASKVNQMADDGAKVIYVCFHIQNFTKVVFCPVVLKISANDTRKSTQNDVHLCSYITMIQSQVVVRPNTLFVLILYDLYHLWLGWRRSKSNICVFSYSKFYWRLAWGRESKCLQTVIMGTYNRSSRKKSASF
jgi:hypothetical protein